MWDVDLQIAFAGTYLSTRFNPEEAGRKCTSFHLLKILIFFPFKQRH